MDEFGDYIIYADESGDHGLESIDPEYPVFVLAFCIFHKNDYTEKAAPSLQRFKFALFGHDMIVLHSHDIRKARGPFRRLINPDFRRRFFERLDALMKDCPVTVIASVIDKNALKEKYINPTNPYTIALRFCLERCSYFLQKRGQQNKLTHLVAESRGAKEDKDLELEFRRICQGGNFSSEKLSFEIVFAKKSVNSTGLQLADLVAHPIGRHVLNRSQHNRAFDIVYTKLDKSSKGRIEGWGLKVFP